MAFAAWDALAEANHPRPDEIKHYSEKTLVSRQINPGLSECLQVFSSVAGMDKSEALYRI